MQMNPKNKTPENPSIQNKQSKFVNSNIQTQTSNHRGSLSASSPSKQQHNPLNLNQIQIVPVIHQPQSGSSISSKPNNNNNSNILITKKDNIIEMKYDDLEKKVKIITH